MQNKNLQKGIITVVIIWTLSLCGFMLYYLSSYQEIEPNVFIAIVHDTSILMFLVFAGLFYFIFDTLIQYFEELLLVQHEYKKLKEVVIIVLIMIDLTIIAQVSSSEIIGMLIFLLIINDICLISYCMYLKKCNDLNLNQNCIIIHPFPKSIFFLAMGSFILFVIQLFVSPIIMYSFMLSYALLIWEEFSRYFRSHQQHTPRRMLSGIYIFTFLLLFLFYQIGLLIKGRMEQNNQNFLIGLIPLFFVFTLLSTIIYVKLINFSRKIVFVDRRLQTLHGSDPELGQVNLEREEPESDSISSLHYICPVCQNALERNIFLLMEKNTSIYCPHCGKKISRHDIIHSTRNSIQESHEKFLKSFSEKFSS